ncbi:hypothetical protein L596_013824 [Steinernema carpocapsae]|uniref:G-protein coupled receptors family 1 profile domain-containing protein n=1 Tax=Steinernema carpocapsae TaxID=34508 RepID=A0A4U5P2K1_STECR|nr:hypothetical protein L596_013824 [Steinernema carpocapsae]
MTRAILTDKALSSVYFVYMGIAVFGLVTNTIFLMVCLCFKKLRTACRLYMAIAFADTVLCFAFLTTGKLYMLLLGSGKRKTLGYIRRRELEAKPTYVVYKSSSACAGEYNVALLTFGSLCPAFLTLYMGFERFLSVKSIWIWNMLRW